jgi:hypothetical protein
MNDTFTPNGFKLRELTAAVNVMPYVPGRMRELGLFTEKRVANVDISVEEKNGVLTLVPVAPRGGPASQTEASTRKMRSFRAPHLPTEGHIMADQIQGVRAFGSENTAEVIEAVRNETLADMRQNLEYTLEYHRVLALKGSFMDANGATGNLFTEFGVTQQTQAIGLHSTNRSQIRNKMFLVTKMIRSALGGTAYTGKRVLCGDDFWAALLDDKDTRDTYLNQAQAAELRGDPANVFTAFGATWEWYEGTSEVNLGSDAYAVPLGVPNLFQTIYAPANYTEAVNRMAEPIYAKAEPMKFGKGFDLEAQSNPLNICTRPASIIKLTIA